MKIIAAFMSLVSGLFLAPLSVQAVPMLDQSQTVTEAGFNSGACCEWQQGVTAGAAGLLTQVDIHINGDAGTFAFEVNLGAPWQDDSADFSTTLTPGQMTGWLAIDVSSAGIMLDVDDKFAIVIDGISANCCAVSGVLSNVYSGGQLYFNGGTYDSGNSDLAFRTYVEAAKVSEPVSLALVGLGLLGALGSSRRRR